MDGINRALFALWRSLDSLSGDLYPTVNNGAPSFSNCQQRTAHTICDLRRNSHLYTVFYMGWLPHDSLKRLVIAIVTRQMRSNTASITTASHTNKRLFDVKKRFVIGCSAIRAVLI